LQTKLGRRLYIQARAQILVSCTHRKKYAPSFILEWSSLELEFFSPEEEHAERLILLGVRMCNLQAYLHDNMDYSTVQGLAEIEAIDEEYVQWAVNPPASMRYQVETATNPPELVFGNQYHVYRGVWIAMLWNHYRTMHILIQAIKWDCYGRLAAAASSPVEASQWTERQSVTYVLMKRISLDVVESVPFYLGYHQQPANSKQALPMHGSVATFLMWPLYSVGAANMGEPAVLDWTVRRLRQITAETGIRQGEVIANMLCQTRRLKILETDREITESASGEHWRV
jgi:hypothetical protein